MSTTNTQSLKPNTKGKVMFSFFKNVKDTKKQKDFELPDYLTVISDPKRKGDFDKLRALPKDEYKKAKLMRSCITGSCTTTNEGRSLKHIKALNGLAVVDIDRLPLDFDDWQELKDVLGQDKYTYLVHLSLSGNGLCIFVKIPIENSFNEIYLSFQEYYRKKYDVIIDLLADPTRLRFISYDQDYILNVDAEIYTDVKAPTATTPATTPATIDKDNFLIPTTPAEIFNNAGEAGLLIIDALLEERGFTKTNGKKGKTLAEYQRAGGAAKSMVAMDNEDVIKFHVFSPNTGLLKTEYNMFDLYKELTQRDNHAAQRALSVLGFGEFHESSKNVFPIEVFPQLFRDYAIDLKETVNYPIDYTATAMLTAIATAAGANLKVLVKRGWIEQGSLFACVIGDAGANKTHPINTIFTPIKALDKERHDHFKYEYEIYSIYEKLSKKDKTEAESIFAPILEKSVLSNFTTEILFRRLSENQRGCTVLSDELISFLEGMNNYSKSDQIGFYLSVWSNQSTTVDRVGNAIPLFISNPYLSILGGLQPRALNKAFPIDKLNNGFYQRFLFAYPDEATKHPLNDNVANEQLAKQYEAFINELFEIDEPKTLMFSPAAKNYFYEWQANNCERVNENQHSVKGEVLSKFDNHFIRLALLVQIMTDKSSTEIEIGAVEAAKALCDYYLTCSFKVLAKIQNKANYLETLPHNKKQLFNELEQSFTTAEAVFLGAEFGLLERAIKSFLKDTLLFKRVKHGSYLKNEIVNE